jgi:hypothetical protein
MSLLSEAERPQGSSVVSDTRDSRAGVENERSAPPIAERVGLCVLKSPVEAKLGPARYTRTIGGLDARRMVDPTGRR